MGSPFVVILLIVCALVACWWIVTAFSPDPLITKLCQLLIFLAAVWLIITKIIPLVA